jgi:hypothetical protein
MLVARQESLYWELLRWMAIISLALATAMTLATRLAGA